MQHLQNNNNSNSNNSNSNNSNSNNNSNNHNNNNNVISDATSRHHIRSIKTKRKHFKRGFVKPVPR